MVALAIADLVAVKSEQEDTASSWKVRARSCRTRIVNAVPLTAIKILLVAWQILTQVRVKARAGRRASIDSATGDFVGKKERIFFADIFEAWLFEVMGFVMSRWCVFP